MALPLVRRVVQQAREHPSACPRRCFRLGFWWGRRDSNAGLLNPIQVETCSVRPSERDFRCLRSAESRRNASGLGYEERPPILANALPVLPWTRRNLQIPDATGTSMAAALHTSSAPFGLGDNQYLPTLPRRGGRCAATHPRTM
jgi:hypothetical protein